MYPFSGEMDTVPIKGMPFQDTPHQGYVFYDSIPTKGMFFQDTVLTKRKGFDPSEQPPHPYFSLVPPPLGGHVSSWDPPLPAMTPIDIIPLPGNDTYWHCAFIITGSHFQYFLSRALASCDQVAL